MMKADATITGCGKYRYVLRRTWDDCQPLIGIVALNPSTADATADDPTVKKCVKLARHWGYGGMVLVNLFAWRATDKSEIKLVDDPIGPRNDEEIRIGLSTVDDVLVAWGNDGRHRDRSRAVREILKRLSKNFRCIKLNRTGEPVHPLYQKDTSSHQPFEP